MTEPSPHAMKPATAAKKLGVHLPATPEEFRAGAVTREQLADLQQNPPEWLSELRRNGPHPRNEVAGRLGISNSGLARAGIEDALTTEQINELRQDPPAWLLAERATFAQVKAEDERLRAAKHDPQS